MRHRGRANKRDKNEPEIIKALEKIGCSVYQLDDPVDLLVGLAAKCYLLEVKGKHGKLTDKQKDFFRDWRGQVRIVRTPEEAIRLVTESYK